MTKEFFTEQILRFEGPITQMISLFPNDKLGWQPTENTMKTHALIQHLAETTPGMVASLVTNDWSPKPADPQGGRGKSKQQLIDEVKRAFAKVRETLGPVTQQRFEQSRVHFGAGPVTIDGTIEEIGVSLVFVHIANHTMQLFWYLRQAGVDADSGTLYFGMPPGQFSTRAPMEAVAHA